MLWAAAMTHFTHFAKVALAAACIATFAGCASDMESEMTLDGNDLDGHWSGDWGHLVLRDVGDEVFGVYSHDQGTVRGHLVGDTFVGWWCEVPSRRANADAGEVELQFVRDGNGVRIDGRWGYGSDLSHDDWDLTTRDDDVPAELDARFADPDAFCRHP